MEAHLMFGWELHFTACRSRPVKSGQHHPAPPWQRQDVSVVGPGMLRLYAAIALFSAIVIIEEGQ
jgi:hypothetical protein